MSDVIDSRNDTKEKILNVALELISQKGLEGTSIRDIAKNADVNLAAVNYHFSSKQGLYLEIIRRSYFNVSKEIEKLSHNYSTTEDLAVAVFEMFMEKGKELVTTFKMILSSESHMPDFGTEDDYFGPPGGAVMFKSLKQNARSGASEEDLYWALKTIFTHIVHVALIFNSACSKRPSLTHMWDEEEVKVGIRRLVRVVLKDL